MEKHVAYFAVTLDCLTAHSTCTSILSLLPGSNPIPIEYNSNKHDGETLSLFCSGNGFAKKNDLGQSTMLHKHFCGTVNFAATAC